MLSHTNRVLNVIYDLKACIRQGVYSDYNRLLDEYIDYAQEAALMANTSSEKVRILIDCAYLLLDTAKDHRVANHWRQQCIDKIYRPLLTAQRYALVTEDDRYIRMFQYQYTRLLPQFFN
ncbi:hypothetical protein [Alteromonas sp. 14N.309.X.WAT.G.H12]|uniref:hypothetical protein n=1 Tax=Alteromonas sp. 14N.309.X.WAT.G.H12 TaxID=3120824 RepID=UPI002FD73C50